METKGDFVPSRIDYLLPLFSYFLWQMGMGQYRMERAGQEKEKEEDRVRVELQ